MSITDELSYCIRTANRSYEDVRNPHNDREILHIPEEELLAIADRIDAEHEAQLNDAFETRNSDENLENDGWVRLPKDADGEPIHVGDWVIPNGMDTSFKVRQICFNGEWSLDLEGFGISQTCPDMCRHYHKPTVEDVLQELVAKVWNRGRLGMPVAESGVRKLVSEYAAKLRELGIEVE